MHWTVRSALKLPTWLMLAAVVASANADERVMFDGGYWGEGRIQAFDPNSGAITIGERRYQLSADVIVPAAEDESSPYLVPGREVIYREVQIGGSGTGLIKEIREMVH